VIEVKFKDEHIKDSPFNVNFAESLAYGPTSFLKQCSFVVQSRDRRGADKETGGANLEVSIKHKKNGKKAEAEVTDNGDGTYGVTYSLQDKGEYEISVKLHDENVGGTPFIQSLN